MIHRDNWCFFFCRDLPLESQTISHLGKQFLVVALTLWSAVKVEKTKTSTKIVVMFAVPSDLLLTQKRRVRNSAQVKLIQRRVTRWIADDLTLRKLDSLSWFP